MAVPASLVPTPVSFRREVHNAQLLARPALPQSAPERRATCRPPSQRELTGREATVLTAKRDSGPHRLAPLLTAAGGSTRLHGGRVRAVMAELARGA